MITSESGYDELMEAIIWIVGIVFSILIAFSFFNAVGGFSVVAFWLLWTLGFSSVFVGYALTGPLAIIQLIVIFIAFKYSYGEYKKKRNLKENLTKTKEEVQEKKRTIIEKESLIVQLKKDLDRIDSPNLERFRIRENEIKVIDTPEDHRKKLLETLDRSREQIIILSGWIMDYSVNEKFRNKLKSCLNRGVDVFIGYGYKSKSTVVYKETKNQATKYLKDLQEWCSANRTKGILEIFHYPNHSKILVCDYEYAINGSFNWLSNGGGAENEERSWIISNKNFIKREVSDLMLTLYDPTKPMDRRKLLKQFVPFSRY